MKNFITVFLVAISFIVLFSCNSPGEGLNVVLKVSPSWLNFEAVPFGEKDVQSFTIKNIGNSKLKINSIKVTQNGRLFKIITDLKFPIVLEAGKKYPKEILVEYTALEEGNGEDEDNIIKGKIEIESNNSDQPVKEILLSAQKPNAILKTSLEEIRFNKIKVGEEEEIELKVYNIGNSPLKFIKYDEAGNVIAENGEAFEFGEQTSDVFELENLGNVRTLEPVKIENGEEVFDSFTIKIKYKPTEDKNYGGVLSIYNTSSNSGPVKSINMSAEAQTCDLRIEPLLDDEDVIDFGERPVDSINKFSIILRNRGGLDCNVDKLEFDEERTTPEFSLELPENTEFPIVITPAGTIDNKYVFQVVYKPTQETGNGGAVGTLLIESNDTRWENGKKEITVMGTSTESDAPVCIIKSLSGGEPYFEVEPGQREDPECREARVCSNVQMISESYDPNPDNSGRLTHTWTVVDAPAAYGNPEWITFPNLDPDNVSNSDHHYVDFYVPYATPAGTRYLIELEVTNEQGISSTCYATIKGLTGNSLHVELFWDVPSDVDLHVMNPTDQNLNLDDIDIEYPSLDDDLENWRERTNIEWWDTGDEGRDCHWRNCKGDGIEWGMPGSEDNPRLDRDDIPGTGPENINIAKPQEGWYRVSVHYYTAKQNGTDTHVRVYCNGTVAYQNSAFLRATNYTWLVNDIYWKDLGDNDGQCYIFSDGRIFDSRQGEDIPGYRGNLLEDIEPDDE